LISYQQESLENPDHCFVRSISLLAVRCSLFAFGFWLLAFGCWLLAGPLVRLSAGLRLSACPLVSACPPVMAHFYISFSSKEQEIELKIVYS